MNLYFHNFKDQWVKCLYAGVCSRFSAILYGKTTLMQVWTRRMASELSPLEMAKTSAAMHATRLIEDGMRVGLGTGSTSELFVKRLGALVSAGELKIDAVATSSRTASLAMEAGIVVSDLNEVECLDIVVDGADEFDGDLNLVKGAGGALLQEKIVASAASRMVVIADDSKRVECLGSFPLPIEVTQFGWRATQRQIGKRLRQSGIAFGAGSLRGGEQNPFVTDEGNYILDFDLKRIDAPGQLAHKLNQIAGVVENGLFVGYCDLAIVGKVGGGVDFVTASA